MSNKVIVMVSDLDDASHGEINILDGPEAAVQFVETLLESGFEQERLRVFGGDELQMQVSHRPVVSLIVGNSRGRKEEAPREEEAAEAPTEQHHEQVAASKTVAARAKAVMEEVAAQPFVRNGVRFSSQFRPA